MSKDPNSPPDRDTAVRIYPFPHARTPPPATPGGFKNLGITPLVRQLGLTTEQTNGHWCSRCQGIWFGYALETACPVCGNRKG